MSATRVLVSGRVQGVGFRIFCLQEARASGVSGWVRNLDDGRVEALFSGPDAAVAHMVQWCRTGPPSARVEDVQTAQVSGSASTGRAGDASTGGEFEIR